ncbi:MAG: queuosine precursor transporter [Verrucomicrobia bacterium]|nr:queuosine precursor transporter [Verrucomicrobiota bacterium]
MNEIIFFSQVFAVLAFGFVALRLGKEALIAYVALQAVLANLFVLKQMPFFGLHATCSDVFAIGSILGLNLLREYFGKETARNTLWICLFSMLFFVVMSQIHLLYRPSFFDVSQSAFETILSSSPRLLAVSIAVFFVVQKIDLLLFNLLKKKWESLSFTLRSNLTLASTQLVDTVLFSILGLGGLVTHLFDIIAVSFFVKLIVIAAMTPLVHASKRWIHVRV